jgi:UTP:GlnB (protein PII) uridylyltransferase
VLWLDSYIRVHHLLQFYVRPSGGVQTFDESRAARLRAMVVASVQRRHPKGLKVHVHSVDRYGCLAALTRVLKAANLSVTRAKVRGATQARAVFCHLSRSGCGTLQSKPCASILIASMCNR